MEKVKVNGITLAYDRRGTGAPLLLLHGFPLDHTTWALLASRLEANFGLIMPDLRGFGHSEVVEGDFTLAHMAADLAGLLDELQIQKTYLAGHSMGGYVALAFAHAYPERVSGLGLLGTQALPDSPESKAGRYATAGRIAASGAGAVEGMAEKLSANPELRPLLREIILRQTPLGLIGALKAMAVRPDAREFAPRFDFPVALVHGQADALIPPDRAREMKILIPQAVLTELQGVGHSAMLEAPDETARALLKLSGLRQ
jgi:pimeloyl-ACP methyl ester carboxylesterase